MAQATEDGYLAACEIQKGRVNLDDTGISLDEILARHPTDARTGLPITREHLEDRYDKTQYEDRILLPDRVLAMSVKTSSPNRGPAVAARTLRPLRLPPSRPSASRGSRST
jgi:hypothetical protein